MSFGIGLSIGMTGSVLAVALALLLFTKRAPSEWRPSLDLVGLFVCLLLNCTGWIVAVVFVEET